MFVIQFFININILLFFAIVNKKFSILILILFKNFVNLIIKILDISIC